MAAGAFNAPELLLDDAEAKQVSNAIGEVAKHYSVNVDPKTLAWLNLGWAVSCVYGSRVVAIGMRKRNEAKAEKERKAADEKEAKADNITGFPKADALSPS